MTKNNFGLTAKQREDLMTVYRSVAPHCHSQQEAYEKVVNSPAPRFYVSPKQAWSMLCKMVVGDYSDVDRMKPIRQELYHTLYDRMEKLSQRKEFIGKSLWFICQFLVNEPAPKFFMQPSNMKFIFNHYKRHGRDYREMDLRKKRASDQAGA